MGKIGIAFGEYVIAVWRANGNRRALENSADLCAEAIKEFLLGVLELVVMVVAAWGIGRAMGTLARTKLGTRLGYGRLLEWVNRRSELETSRSTLFGFKNPAFMAKQWQGKGDYPGVDDWTNIKLNKGTKVWGGTPGQSNFYTTDQTLQITGNNASKIFQGLQVGKGRFMKYRPGMTQYEVTHDIMVGYSKALANPQYGTGGFEQVFIPKYEGVLKPIKSIILTNR